MTEVLPQPEPKNTNLKFVVVGDGGVGKNETWSSNYQHHQTNVHFFRLEKKIS